MEEKETGPQLIWMTREDMIHLIVPIGPEVAVVFCNEPILASCPGTGINRHLAYIQ
jgi:hypothetical protein